MFGFPRFLFLKYKSNKGNNFLQAETVGGHCITDNLRDDATDAQASLFLDFADILADFLDGIRLDRVHLGLGLFLGGHVVFSFVGDVSVMFNQCQRYLIYSHYCRSQIKILKKLQKSGFFYNLNILMEKDTRN